MRPLNLVKVFLLMILLGGLGGAAGSLSGNSLGTGGALAGGVILGVLAVLVGALIAERFRWIAREQRVWTMLGAFFGYVLATMVTLSTLTSSIAPFLSTILVGLGAVLGAVVGHSPHGVTSQEQDSRAKA